MSIAFHCLCGKRLKARESSAGKRTQCPQCGEPVGIPASAAPAAPPSSRKEAADAATAAAREILPIPASILPPTESDGAATRESRASDRISPQQVGRSLPPTLPVAATATSAEDSSTPKPYFMVDENSPPPPPRIRKKRRDKKGRPQTRGLPAGIHPGSVAEAASQTLAESPEKGVTLRKPPKWYRLLSRQGEGSGPGLLHELGYSLGNFPQVASISFLLALTLSAGAAELPQAMQQSGYAPAFFIVVLVAFLLVAAHSISFFNQSIQIAIRNDGNSINLDPVLTAKASFAWIVAVLAGPVLPAAGTFFYWLRIGLADPVDWVILAELIWLTFFWLTAALLSYGIDPRLKSVLPHRAFQNVMLIPWAIAIRSAFAAFLCSATIAGIWYGLVAIHVEPFYGFLIFGGTFLAVISLGATLAASLGQAAIHVIPKAEPKTDAKAEEFERELASHR